MAEASLRYDGFATARQRAPLRHVACRVASFSPRHEGYMKTLHYTYYDIYAAPVHFAGYARNKNNGEFNKQRIATVDIYAAAFTPRRLRC